MCGYEWGPCKNNAVHTVVTSFIRHCGARCYVEAGWRPYRFTRPTVFGHLCPDCDRIERELTRSAQLLYLDVMNNLSSRGRSPSTSYSAIGGTVGGGSSQSVGDSRSGGARLDQDSNGIFNMSSQGGRQQIQRHSLPARYQDSGMNSQMGRGNGSHPHPGTGNNPRSGDKR